MHTWVMMIMNTWLEELKTEFVPNGSILLNQSQNKVCDSSFDKMIDKLSCDFSKLSIRLP